MPSRLVGISKVAAYCLQLGTEMHSDRSNYILHIEVIPGHWGLVFTLSPKTSLALFSQQMLLCALDVSNSICKYFSKAISSSESLLAKGCLLSWAELIYCLNLQELSISWQQLHCNLYSAITLFFKFKHHRNSQVSSAFCFPDCHWQCQLKRILCEIAIWVLEVETTPGYFSAVSRMKGLSTFMVFALAGLGLACKKAPNPGWCIY